MNEWVWSNGGMILTGENWSTGRKTLYSVCGRWMNEYGAMVEWYWQGKTEVLGEKLVQLWFFTRCLAWNGTQTSLKLEVIKTEKLCGIYYRKDINKLYTMAEYCISNIEVSRFITSVVLYCALMTSHSIISFFPLSRHSLAFEIFDRRSVIGSDWYSAVQVLLQRHKIGKVTASSASEIS